MTWVTAAWGIVIFTGFTAFAIWLHRLLDGRNFLLDAWERFRLGRKSLTEWDTHRLANQNQTDIIVSLTTIPERIDKISDTLKSLFAQAIAPREIHLYAPAISRRSGAKYEIPANLSVLKSIRIIRCDDHGPATKFLDALKTSMPDQRILVVDDDKLYPRCFLEQIEAQSNNFPDYALGYSGWRIPDDLTDRPTSFWLNVLRKPPAPVKSPWIKKKYAVDILQGYSGYLVKPRFFDIEKLGDYRGAPEAAFYVDDVWLSAHCTVPKFVIPAERFCMEPAKNHSLYKKTSLGKINSGGEDPTNRNNTILIRHFKEKWQKQGE